MSDDARFIYISSDRGFIGRIAWENTGIDDNIRRYSKWWWGRTLFNPHEWWGSLFAQLPKYIQHAFMPLPF